MSDVARDVEAALGYSFRDHANLVHALTHRSYVAEHEGAQSNERLEFLGDSVLSVVVTDFIFRTYGDLPEGALAQLRASVVNAEVLAVVAEDLGIGDGLLLGKGEESSGGRTKRSILADAVEAVIGAVYVDDGLEAARAVVMELLGPLITENGVAPGATDFKTRLQEALARRGVRPAYEVHETGPDHAKLFTARVLVGAEVYGLGQGRSKKAAEQAAAREGMTRLLGSEDAAAGA